MHFARTVASLGVISALGACAFEPALGPSVLITPGRDKDPVAFQQDQVVCQQHAESSSGYGGAAQPAPPAAAVGQTPVQLSGPQPGAANQGAAQRANNAAVPADIQTPGEVNYIQCMAARGDIVQMSAAGAPGNDYGYGIDYPYAYPYAYGYPFGYGYPNGYDYPFGVGFVGFGGGYGYGRLYHGGYYHGGYYHGGWGRGGFHGGGFHGGGFHGGGGHGGGGRR